MNIYIHRSTTILILTTVIIIRIFRTPTISIIVSLYYYQLPISSSMNIWLFLTLYIYHSQLPVSSLMNIHIYRSTTILILTTAIIIRTFRIPTISIIVYLYYYQLPISSSMNIHCHRSTSLFIITTDDVFYLQQFTPILSPFDCHHH